VHNRSDLVTRPHILRLVADQLGALERPIASGERVDAAALYDELVASWLARDEGKHQLRKDDKLRLMEELHRAVAHGPPFAAGRPAGDVAAPPAWCRRRTRPVVRPGASGRGRAGRGPADRDVRRAPGADDFTFAHTSLRVWDAAGGEELLAVHALEGREYASLAATG
jgi:hypothetical protein